MIRPLFPMLVLSTALCGTASAAPLPTIVQSIAIADRAWTGNPCAGRVRVVPARGLRGWTDPDVYGHRYEVDADELAVGRVFDDDGGSRLVSCDLEVDARLISGDPARTCDVIVHGVYHLAGNRWHTHDGSVTDFDAPPYPTCHRRTRHERARDVVRASLPHGYRWTVHCNGRSTRCRATSLHARTRVYHIDHQDGTAELVRGRARSWSI